jgi:hypothetical protein
MQPDPVATARFSHDTRQPFSSWFGRAASGEESSSACHAVLGGASEIRPYQIRNRWVAQHLLNDIAIPESDMNKLSSSQFSKRKYLPLRSTTVSPFSGRPVKPNLFLAKARCPSGQLQVVAIQLPFVHSAPRLIS